MTLGWTCLCLTGCGAAPRSAPTQQEAATIAASVSDIVYQCQAVAVGYVASADNVSLNHDVDALVDAVRRLRVDSPFVVGTPPGLTQRTTLRREVALSARILQDPGCAPTQAQRLAGLLGHR